MEGVHDVVFCEESTSWMPTVTLKDFAQNDSTFLIDKLMPVMWSICEICLDERNFQFVFRIFWIACHIASANQFEVI